MTEPLLHAVYQTNTPELASRILALIGVADTVQILTKLSLGLQLLASIAAIEFMAPRSQSQLNRELEKLQKKLLETKKLLEQTLVAKALNAVHNYSSIYLSSTHGQSGTDQPGDSIYALDYAASLIEQLQSLQRQSSQRNELAALLKWLVEDPRPYFIDLRFELLPYILTRSSSRDKLTSVILWIFQVYEFVFETRAAISDRRQKPTFDPSHEARFHGPMIRFSLNVLREMPLLDVCNNLSDIELQNAIGDAFNNHYRGSKNKKGHRLQRS